MWDGPGQRPRGGPPFRGDHRGEMFAGRDGPMPDFRGRDGMNMGPRPLDLPPMDMRRGDGPPMRGRDMEQRDMRDRDQNRDFFRSDEERDLSLRRQYEMSIRDKLMTAPGFMGPGRNSSDMEDRGMPQREPMNRLMDMRDRDMYRHDMQDMDGRRGFPLEPMGRNDGFRDMRDRPPMGRDDIDGCDMDMPSRERRMMDFDRRGGPPFNARGGFDSDMDFRNRPGPEFRDRDRSPVRDRFGNDDRAPMERGRPGFRGAEGAHRDREFLHSTDSPPIDHYRSGEEMTLAEEWKNRRKEKPPLTNLLKGIMDQTAPPSFGRESILGPPPPFSDRERQPAEFPGKDAGFPRDQFAARDLPSVGLKAPLDLPFPEMGLPGLLGRAPESKLWLGEGDPKQIPNDGRPPYHQDKNEKIQGPPSEGFKGLKAIVHDQRPDRAKIVAEPEFQSGSATEGRDQDYRDIDYRTGSVRSFDYKHEPFHAPEKVLKESKPFPPPKFSDSGSKDQDYRSATVEDKVSNTISIIGIPKTATMEQILGAFAVRDGVPMQGMKIKSVVPGYSYDTAYVEFLNLDDAVHFMESNKGSLKVGARTASMKYVQPDKSERDLHESLPQRPTIIPQVLQEALLPGGPGELLDSSKNNNVNGSSQQQQATELLEPLPPWQRNCDLTPEAWQQQVDQQLKQQDAELQSESWAGRNNNNPPRHGPPPHGDPIFKESKTMILKNVKPTTTVETILKALDPFAYLDERNVRLVKGKTPGAKCFCFVDMDSHEQVVRLVELLTKPRPLNVDGVRVYAEVAKPLKNQNIKRESDKPFTSILGYPPDANMMEPPQIPDFSLQYSQHLQQAVHPPADMQGDPMAGSMTMNPPLLPDPSYTQGVVYGESPAVVDPSYHQSVAPPMSAESAAMMTSAEHGAEVYVYGSETPDMSGYLYDGTSGFFYDPQTTLYYDPNSRYFYNSQTQEYLYWDGMTKTYIPVPSGGSTTETVSSQQPLALSAEVQAILANPAADAPLEMKKPADPTPPLPLQSTPTLPPPIIEQHVQIIKDVAPEVKPPPAPDAAGAAAVTAPPPPAPAAAATAAPPPAAPTPEPALPSLPLTPEKREDDDSKKDNREEKPRSLAAVKIMKDMERWAKIQNRQKDAVRSPSPVLKPGHIDDKKTSKAADAGFAIFAKAGAGDDLFKKPMAPPKKDHEKGKRPLNSLGLLASDYGAGSDEEVEEEKHEAPKPSKSKSDDKDDKLTDWKKMACLLCRRQFPNKDALIRHQQLSDLHKQNMEIHLKIKRSKKELEALENQEKELIAKDAIKSPEPKGKRQKHHHQQQQHHHNTWAGSSKDSFKGGSERPGLGAEPVEKKKKEPVVWDHATYKQAVRKAMFARFKELD